MNPQFEIQCEIVGLGWMDIQLRAGEECVYFVASYITDVLDDLASAVELIAAGVPRLEIFMCLEPDYVDWVFEDIDGKVLFRLNHRDGTTIPGRSGQVKEMFRVEITRLQLVSEVRRCMDWLLAEFGEEGYLEKWKSPFPRKELRQLECTENRLHGLAIAEALRACGRPTDALLVESWQSSFYNDAPQWMEKLWSRDQSICLIQDRRLRKALLAYGEFLHEDTAAEADSYQSPEVAYWVKTLRNWLGK